MRAAGIRVVAIRRNLDDDTPASQTGVRLVAVRTDRPGAVDGSAHRIVVEDLRHVVAATEPLLLHGEPDDRWCADDDWLSIKVMWADARDDYADVVARVRRRAAAFGG